MSIFAYTQLEPSFGIVSTVSRRPLFHLMPSVFFVQGWGVANFQLNWKIHECEESVEKFWWIWREKSRKTEKRKQNGSACAPRLTEGVFDLPEPWAKQREPWWVFFVFFSFSSSLWLLQWPLSLLLRMTTPPKETLSKRSTRKLKTLWKMDFLGRPFEEKDK